MAKHGKQYRKAQELASKAQAKSLSEGLSLLLESAYAKFDESADVAIVLGIDPAKGEQSVRGSVLLPHGKGKDVKVLVFAKGDQDKEARDAGADYVGVEDLVEKIEQGWMDFDVAVATPDLMGVIGKVARILGPRGLLPNKKVGTVTFDVGRIVKELKQGRVSFKNDKGGILHALFGKVSFSKEKLKENLEAFMKAVVQSKPATSKGKFIRKVVISSTMGVGIEIDTNEFL